MSANLKKLQEFVDKMKSTSSLLEKKTIIETIKNDDFITNALYYTYNQFLKFNVTSKNCKKNSDKVAQGYHTLFQFQLICIQVKKKNQNNQNLYHPLNKYDIID